MPDRTYDFSAAGGNVRFFAIDTNGVHGYLKRDWPGLDRQLAEDIRGLEKKRRESHEPYKIVLGHHPMYAKSKAYGVLISPR